MSIQKYECQACGYVYDPQVDDEDGGVRPDTAFRNPPEDWKYPLCRTSKDKLGPIE